MELVTQRKFAEIIGTSTANVNKLIKAGKIPIVKGKVILDKALIAYELIKKNTTTNSMSDGMQSAVDIALALNKAKLAKEQYLAKLKQLEYEIKQGEYVAITEVEADAEHVATLLRTTLLSLPSRLALQLENKSAHEAQAILEDEINILLTNLNSTRF
ncbi:MAG TPA: hypothetical protein PKD00_06905 [Burkholderiales bacterium]|nr:hypothetical protein [Burkholderiales bacterium]